jgi:chemotaxis signal transduction protein
MSRHVEVLGPTTSRAVQMRVEFDSAFSRVPVNSQIELTDVLALSIDEQPCLLRLSDLAEVIAHPAITAVPTQAPALLGLAARRGHPVGVYDLGRLLGRAPVTPRWLVFVAAEPGIALAFESLDGYRRIELSENKSRELIEMSTVIDRIGRLAPHRSEPQESDS